MGNICHTGQPDIALKVIKEYRFLDSLVAFINSEKVDSCLEGGLFALFEVLKVGDRVG